MSSIPTIDRLIPRFDHLKWKMAAAGVAVGLISGLLVVVYRLGIEYGTDCARWMYAQIRNQPWLLVPWMAAAAGSALLIARMRRSTIWCPLVPLPAFPPRSAPRFPA